MAFLSRQKKIIYSLVALVIFLLGAESGLRLVCWATGRVPYYSVVTRWMRPDYDLIFDMRPNYKGKIYRAEARINNLGLRGEDITERKPRGTWRALCLGDSTTFGYAVNQGESYPEQLQRILRKRFRDRAIEVLNAGRPSYTSYQGLRYLETRGLKFEPDVVLVAFGHNDRRFVLKPEQSDNPEWFKKSARVLLWRSRVRNSYLMLAAGKILGRLLRENTWRQDVLSLPSQRLEDLHPRVDVVSYRQNLRAIARICRQRNIPVVFLIMSDAPRIVKAFARGRRLRSEKRFDEAIAVFSNIGRGLPEALYRRWFKALAFYEIGLTREAQGRTTEAATAFRQSAQAAAFWSAAGGTPVRFAADYTKAMREVAQEFSAPIVDVAKLLVDRPGLYVDHCHFRAEGQRLIAQAVARCLIENKLITAQSQSRLSEGRNEKR